MAADNGNLRHWPLPVTDPSSLPRFIELWAGDTLTYPTARGQDKPARGWVCGGCGRGLSPAILECPHCPEGPHGGTAAPVMGEWDDDL